jgi:hypothetical protein
VYFFIDPSHHKLPTTINLDSIQTLDSEDRVLFRTIQTSKMSGNPSFLNAFLGLPRL